ncbi:MAG: DMT family transporter [Pseudomonadota bacterium]
MPANNPRAALFIVIGMALITTNDAFFKHISQDFGVGQIMFIRGLIICSIFFVFLRIKKLAAFGPRVFHKWNLIRAGFEVCATFAFLSGLSMLPLATASTLAFSSPIFLAVFAYVFLREPVGLLRWAVILFGFFGVMLITNPFVDAFHWAVVLPVVCAVFVALRDIAVRYVPAEISSMQVAFTHAWMVTLAGGLIMLLDGPKAVSLEWLPWFAMQAGALFCGYICYVVGTRISELSYVGPFKYSSVLLAILIGYFVWGEAPTMLMLVGAAVIVISGIMLLVGEKRQGRAPRDRIPDVDPNVRQGSAN